MAHATIRAAIEIEPNSARTRKNEKKKLATVFVFSEAKTKRGEQEWGGRAAAEPPRENRRPKEGQAEKDGPKDQKDPKDQGKARPRKPTAGTGPRAAERGGRRTKKEPKGKGGKTANGPQGPKGRKGGGGALLYCLSYPMERKNGTSFRPPLGPIVSRHEQTKAHCYNVLL